MSEDEDAVSEDEDAVSEDEAYRFVSEASASENAEVGAVLGDVLCESVATVSLVAHDV